MSDGADKKPNILARAGTWLLNFWFAPEHPSRLLVFERMFAFTFLMYMGAWAYEGAYEWLTTLGFHYPLELSDTAYSTPWPPMDPAFLPFFLIILLGAPTLLMFGIARLPMVIICLFCAIYVQRVDTYSAFTINKLFVVCFTLLVIAPRAVEVVLPDGTTGLRRSAWVTRTIQATLIIQYGTAGICKYFQGDWHQHADILLGHSVGLYRTEIAGWLVSVLPHWAWVVQTFLALAFELAAPFLFGIRKLRPIGYFVGFNMHVVIAVLMVDLFWFSAQMVTFYLLFMQQKNCIRWFEAIERPRVWLYGKFGREAPIT